jgi:cysteine desulfurase
VCFSVDGLDAPTLMMALDDRGFRIGSGSMCSGLPSDPSPVLDRIGVPDTPGFRVGVGSGTSEADVEAFLETLPLLAAELERVEAASTDALARFRAPGEDRT